MARQKPETRIQKMLRSDGALCLSFINTGRGQRPALESYAELLAWSAETGALDAATAARLEQAAAERSKAAAGVARKAVDLHARLGRMVAVVVGGGQAEAADLEALNVDLGVALGHRLLVDTAAGFHWSWDQGDEIDRPLWPVLLSAGKLLASQDVRRIRRCPSQGCGLFFVARGSGRPRKVVRRRLLQSEHLPAALPEGGQAGAGEAGAGATDSGQGEGRRGRQTLDLLRAPSVAPVPGIRARAPGFRASKD